MEQINRGKRFLPKLTICHCSLLTHFQLMFHFYTLLKTSKNRRFSDVFRGYRSETLVKNRLKMKSKLDSVIDVSVKFFQGTLLIS